MRYPAAHKQQAYERILRAAGSLFRKRGYAATGIDSVMASANLTAGAFYAHFRSKEDLLAKALDDAFCGSRDVWSAQVESHQGRSWVQNFVSFYLSGEHRETPESGCPMPSLAPEIRRIDGTPRTVFEERLRDLVALVQSKTGLGQGDRSRAISAIALSVGGLMLSRAVKEQGFSDEILGACREAVIREVEHA
jgi:TetR/AcrR family transcriptional regulator, transcriptional repressor for nem operon